MKNSIKNQSGFAHAVVIVLIVALLIGGLGYVYFDYLKSEKAPEDKPLVVDDLEGQPDTELNGDSVNPPVSSSSFSQGSYAFSYPLSGWNIDTTDIANDVVVARTDDFKSGPMGIQTGASIQINKLSTEYYSTIDEMISSYQKKGMIQAVEDVMVDGKLAKKFNCYEFCLYTVLVEKDGVNYEMKFSTLDYENAGYKDAFALFLSSLKIK